MNCSSNVMCLSDGTCKPTTIQDLTRILKHPSEGSLWDCTAVEGNLREKATCRACESKNFGVRWSS